MKISIIIPTYKPEDYIYRCLDSIKKQSLDSSLFEIIIILNGDKEPYYTKISGYIANNLHNARLIHTQNSGVSLARNLGLDLSIGENIVFVDDDDYISENYLENLLLSKKENTSIVVSNLKCDNNDVLSDDYYSKAFTSLKDKKYNLLKFRKFLSSPCGKLIDREVISKVRFNTKLKTSEDAMFCFEISKNIKEIKLSDDSCIYYRIIRLNSASRKKQSLIYLLKELFTKIKILSIIYFKSPFSYNLFFYFTRILAFTKFLLLKLR